MFGLSNQFLKIASFLFLIIIATGCKLSTNDPKNTPEIQHEEVSEDLPGKKASAVIIETIKSNAKPGKIFSRDTIKIEKDNYKNKILLSKEMLFDYCKPASSLPCYIDADKFLNYIGQGVYNVYDPKLVENGLFTEKELVNNLASIKDYIKQGLSLNNELKLKCPSSKQREKTRNMLGDINHSIYYLMKWPYFAD